MATKSLPYRLLKPAEVAELIGVDSQLPADWRHRRVGPTFLKLGHRTVRYDPAAIYKWMAARQVSGECA